MPRSERSCVARPVRRKVEGGPDVRLAAFAGAPRRCALGLVAAFALGGSVVATSLPVHSQQQPALLAPAPVFVSGARILNVSVTDAQAMSPVAGASLVTELGPIACVYSTSGTITVPLKLPSAATIVQIDVYDYNAVNDFSSWVLTDRDPTAARRLPSRA